MIALTSSQYRKVARGESIRVKLIGARGESIRVKLIGARGESIRVKLIRVKFKPSAWKGFLAYLGWS